MKVRLTAPADADAALVARGEYLAKAGDCIACHTAPSGAPLKYAVALPLSPRPKTATFWLRKEKTGIIGA